MLTAPGLFNINADGTSCQGTWQCELQWCQTPGRHTRFARQNYLAEHFTDNGKILSLTGCGRWVTV